MKKVLFIITLILSVQAVFGQFRNRSTVTSGGSDQFQDYSSPVEYEIAEIDVKGLKVLDKNALISLTGLRVGDKINVPGDEISGAIRKLWNHGLVGDVSVLVDKIEEGRVWLTIELTELPRLTGFTFEGVPASRETELREDLNLYRGKVVNDATISKAALTVRKNFQSRGYLNARVDVVREIDSVNNDGLKLRIVVDQKQKVKINNIIIEGNNDIDDARLKHKLKNTGERPRFTLFKKPFEMLFGFTPRKAINMATKTHEVSYDGVKQYLNDNVKLNVFKNSKLKEKEYGEDKQALIAYYNSKGYRDALIVSDSIYAHDEKSINIKIKVEEGNQYYIRDIAWTGNYVYPERVLGAVLDVNKGEVYNKEEIDKKLNFNPKGMDISGLYMDDGYLFFNIQAVEVRIEGDSIDLEMRIFEGDQAIISRVTFKGNDRTSDHVIRRELSTVPGEKFSRSDLIRTQQMLAQMGYFDPEKVKPNYFPNPADGTVDIEWDLTERSNDQIELSGGWGGYYGFVGTLGVTLNNFSVRNMMKGKFTPYPAGDGQRLSMRMQANGPSYQNYSFSFTEPWMGGKKPNSFTISLNSTILRRVRNEDRDGDGIAEYFPGYRAYNSSIRMKGITLGLGKRLEWPDPYFTLATYLSYQNYFLTNFYDYGQGFNNGSANNISLNFNLSRNSIDNPMYPKSGSSIAVSATFTPPYSYWRNIDYNTAPNQEKYKWVEFHKWMIDGKYYLNIFDKLVIEAKAHFGVMGRYNPNINVGPFERYYMGGSGMAGQQRFIVANDIVSLRGYDEETLTPPYGIESQDGIKGGIIYDKLGMELRYPVTTGEAATIYGFIFAEGGNNWYSYEEFNPFEMYRSAGVGVRIFMPAFGLIGINWGYPFDKLPGSAERPEPQIQFSIGQQLR